MNKIGEDESRWDQAADRLISMTEAGTLSWSVVELPLRPLMLQFVGPQHVAEIEGRRVAVYEKAYPALSDEYGSYTDSHVIVEFIDDHGDPIWVWPLSGARRSSLLDAIRDASVDGEGFLNRLLGVGVGES